MMIRAYVHEKMNQEIDAISGHYTFLREVRHPFHEREILYIVGCAVIDNSCCGVGGCGFALVPGYVISWKSKINEQGKYISLIEPFKDSAAKKELTRFIKNTEIVTQVQFW